ncbi:MAG: type I restriction enzyme HsdR N-terminal domain-containing protein [Rhodothermales bacterium]|nr:type I restriction enzyme HsdR N-terminal domain-containing protein [Rhodothermales bacterium]
MNASSDRLDPVRRRLVADGPEEAVRQAFLRYLLEERSIPRGLISVESGVSGASGSTAPRTRDSGRTDIVVHDRTGRPWMLIECKAPDVPLDQSVWNQAARYNRVLDARYVLVTNGRRHLCAEVQEAKDESPDGASFLATFPEYPDMKNDDRSIDD